MRRRRVAILVGQADEEYQSRFIEGFLKQAFQEDLDTCIFSMYRKYQDAADREIGESNIFSLFVPEQFDAVIFLKDTIQIDSKIHELEQWLHNDFKGPVLVIEQHSDLFPSVFTDGYTGMKMVIDHLIEEHGFKDIAFLSGKKWHLHSIERLKAYRDSMEEHGLTVNEDNIYYGDFWYTNGERCVNQLLIKNGRLPQAIAAANDCMAIGVAQALTKRGYRVPEDVAVVSYDSSEEGRTSPKPITSAQIPTVELGGYSAEYIAAKLDDREIPAFEAKPRLIIGRSCGCSECTDTGVTGLRKEWGTVISEAGFFSVNSTMAEDLMIQSDLMGFLTTIYSYSYQLKGALSFHLCLNRQWKDVESDPRIHFDADGYSDEMLYAIKYLSSGSGGRVSVTDTFPAAQLLPELEEESEKPRAFIFTPVHFEEECFGYAAISYGEVPRSYDEIYRSWIKLVSRCLESFRREMLTQTVINQNEAERVWSTIGNIKPGIEASLTADEKRDLNLVDRILNENLLTYHFQPIIRVSDGDIYSYEALMRSATEQKISPLKIIKYADMLNRLPDVEGATFLNVFDILENIGGVPGNRKIFINSIPGLKVQGAAMTRIQNMLSKYSDNVVVELTEEAEVDENELESMKEWFRSMGLELAVDDYGTGYSNVSNLLRYMPDYVKIDRSLISEIQDRPQKQHFVREVIEFCHENNIMALAEGVETSEELRMSIHLGADLIQGFYTARPAAEFIDEIDDSLRKEIRNYVQERQDGQAKSIYIAGKTNRVLLSNLIKTGITDILIPAENVVYKDISIVGAPGVETKLHMRVASGYMGRIMLENVYFANVKNRPCIEFGENSEVTLTFIGENVLKGGGIQVPASTTLFTEGSGSLSMRLSHSDYYGIGNGPEEEHGRLCFYQDGEVRINAAGKKGICIGSGKGGRIEIRRGKYILDAKGDVGVGIGSFENDEDISLADCEVTIDQAITRGVSIGSMHGSAKVSVSKASVDITAGGAEFSGLGTIDGKRAEIAVREASGNINIRADQSTCVGSLRGSTVYAQELAGVSLDNGGPRALAVGGYSEDTHILIREATLKVKLRNELGVDTYAGDDQIRIINGRNQFVVNGKEIVRESEEGYV